MILRLLKITNIPLMFIMLFVFYSTDGYIEAHKPFFPDPAPTSEDSILISNPNISQVLYFILDNKTNEFWINMKLEKGHNLILDLGAPKLSELKNIFPELYLYNKIDQKEFSEIYSFKADSQTKVSEFHEPFTDTHSWVYLKKRYIIEEQGDYFIKIKSSSDIKTKIWFATGVIEDFGITDLINFAGTRSDVKNFHKPDELNEPKNEIIIPESIGIVESENNTMLSESNNKITNLNIYFIIIFVSIIIIMIFFIKYKLK